MEFLICLWIASLLTGIRPITDMVQALKGKEPAHLTKAKLQAKREAERNAARLARAENRGVRPGEDLPTFGDALRVWRRSLWQDAIDYRRRTSAEKASQQHENRRAEGEQREPARVRPAVKERAGRFFKWLLNGPEKHWDQEKPGERPVWSPIGDEDWVPPDEDDLGSPGAVHDTNEYKMARNHCWECPTCGAVGLDYPTREAATAASNNHFCDPSSADPEAQARLHNALDPERGSTLDDPEHPAAGTADDNPYEGEDMTDATQAGTATGDAHDVESAIAECNALDDDLTAINTALDVIDERIDAAGTAAEHIEAFLASKNVDDSAVGGMSVARDMLSPTHIKALMDAVAAAKQGVQSALDELVRLQELESQLNGADGSVLNGR